MTSQKIVTLTGNSTNDFAQPKSSADLTIRRLDCIETSVRQVLTRETFFDGGDILSCHAGSFKFTFLGYRSPITLSPGETLVVYPGNTVTIESTRAGSRLKYAIFSGAGVTDYFDSFGFYNLLKFSGDAQEHLFDLAAREKEPGKAFGYIEDALITFRQRLRTGSDKRLHAALATIGREIRHGRTNVKAVCSELDVSRATLNRTFAEARLGNPSDYIQEHLAARATQLLISTETPIAEIARSLGINSPAYFTEFVRRQTGSAPRELRKSGANKQRGRIVI